MPRTARPGLLTRAELQREVDVLQLTFPDVSVREGGLHRRYHVLEGTLQPFAEDSPLELIAAHLAAGIPLLGDATGRLHPTRDDLSPYPVTRSDALFRPYEFNLLVMEAPAYPRLYFINPVIDARSQPRLEHLHRWTERESRAHPEKDVQRELPTEDVCFHMISDGVWRPRRDRLSVLLDIGTEWLGTFLLWRYGTDFEWLAITGPHGEAMYHQVPSGFPCPCGSGYSFERCHKGELGSRFQKQRRRVAPRWLPGHVRTTLRGRGAATLPSAKQVLLPSSKGADPHSKPGGGLLYFPIPNLLWGNMANADSTTRPANQPDQQGCGCRYVNPR
jgi:hypothetical protein